MILKRIGLAVMVIGMAAFGVDTVANAQTGDYPPAAATVVVSNTTPPAGGTITVTVSKCKPGENGVITLPPGAPVKVVCDSGGTAVASLTVPTQPGTYTGTAVFANPGTLTFQVTVAAVPGAGLPATGSNGTQSGIWFGLGLLGIGAALVGVSQVRRRQTRLA